jgi:hypothetical protein
LSYAFAAFLDSKPAKSRAGMLGHLPLTTILGSVWNFAWAFAMEQKGKKIRRIS